MDYIRGLEAYQDSREAAITLGKFDGVHRGHPVSYTHLTLPTKPIV